MASERPFLLPDLGEGLTEAEVVRWLVAVGDVVAVDQPVAEVETAKAVVEVPSPFAGTVVVLHAEVGQEVTVGAPLLSVSTAEPAAAVPSGPADAPGSPPEQALASLVAPTRPAPREDNGGSGNVLVGYGTSDGAGRRRRRSGANGHAGVPVPQAPSTAARGTGAVPLAKPPVRKLARDLGVDLVAVAGTGSGGAITRGDVEAAAAPRTPPAPSAPGEVRIPVRGIRRVIAEKMAHSRREIPDATTWVDCDATRLLELRDSLNLRQSAVRVSPFALVLRAVVAGLREFPALNAHLDVEAGEIVQSRGVHLGVAAATDRGLLVPVIRHADRRSTLDLAAEIVRLGAAARDGTVAPVELVGGTFTVSNYGAFGVDGGSPVINHPEAAILGVGRIADKPWVVDGQVAVRAVVQLSVAFDHRIADGAEAGGFLRFVADCVEDPAFLLGAL